MKKIYCKNCKWFERFCGSNYCHTKSKEQTGGSFNEITGLDESFLLSSIQIAGVKYDFEVCETLNKNNDCKYFKRTWFSLKSKEL